jgi:hypothetical protein
MNMDPLERQLKSALKREQPTGDFAARVLARVEQEKSLQPWWRMFFAATSLRWATAVALCVLVVGGFVYQREEARERAEGEAAKQQVMLALRIAGTKVKLAQDRVQQMSDRTSRRN